MKLRLGVKKFEEGFTLIEVVLALSIMAVISAAIMPRFITAIQVKAAQKTAAEMHQIQSASKWFHIDQGRWPANIDDLKSSGYLNSSWNAVNPFGNPYNLGSDMLTLSISSTLPQEMKGVVEQALPGVTYVISGENATVTTSIPRPGFEASISNKVNRSGDTMTGDLYGPGVYFSSYYDRDNPQYFMDLASSSNINTLTSQGMTVNNDTAPRIIYRKGGADRFDAGVGTDNRFYISDMSNRVIQMDAGSGNTSIRGSITTDNSLYGNVYYDRYNPGYYTQPRGTSRLNHIDSNTHSNNDWLSSSNIYADYINTDYIDADSLYLSDNGNVNDIYLRRIGKWASELGGGRIRVRDVRSVGRWGWCNWDDGEVSLGFRVSDGCSFCNDKVFPEETFCGKLYID